MDLSYSPVPIDTVATARDFQDRVARLAGAVFVIAAVLGAASAATHLATQSHESESGSVVHELVHLASLVPSLAIWLRCRGKLMSMALVEAMDAALTISMCLLYAMLGWSGSTSLSVAFSVVLAMSYTLVARSIIVPSAFRRTLWISALGAAPAIAYFAQQGVSSAFAQSPESGQIFSMFGTLWCVLAVLAAAVNSRQLYGLRAQLREIQYTPRLEDHRARPQHARLAVGHGPERARRRPAPRATSARAEPRSSTSPQSRPSTVGRRPEQRHLRGRPDRRSSAKRVTEDAETRELYEPEHGATHGIERRSRPHRLPASSRRISDRPPSPGRSLYERSPRAGRSDRPGSWIHRD